MNKISIIITLILILVALKIFWNYLNLEKEPFDTIYISAYKSIIENHGANKSANDEKRLIKQGLVKDAYNIRAQNVKRLVVKIIRFFEDYGIQYWIDSGILLGIYNYQDVLPYDGDADVGIPSNYVEILNKIPEKVILNKYGLDINKRTKKPLLFAIKDIDTDVYCDLFVFDIKENTIETENYDWWCEGCQGKNKNMFVMNKEIVYPLQKFNLGGTIVNIPNKPREYLEFLYGKDLVPYYKWDDKRNDYVRKDTIRKIVITWCKKLKRKLNL